MAKATVGAAGIEYIQGAMLKPKRKEGHKHGNYLIMTHRSAPTTNPNCQRVYSKPADAYDRTTPVTESERIVRQRLAAVSRGISALKKDVSKMTAAVAEYNAQKDNPGGFKTLYQFLWHKVANELEG